MLRSAPKFSYIPYFNGPIPFLFKAEKNIFFSCQGTETENNKEGFCIPTSAWIYPDIFLRDIAMKVQEEYIGAVPNGCTATA